MDQPVNETSEFQRSKTYANLQNAYNDKLIAGSKYSIYGERARADGYQDIGNYFEFSAGNEQAIAIVWLRLLNNGQYPSTLDNLLSASTDETQSGDTTYREYARIAQEEGYNDIAALFRGVANIDLNHGLQFKEYADAIQNEQVFCKPSDTLWICLRCGNIMGGTCAPKICPVCGFPQSYYKEYTV